MKLILAATVGLATLAAAPAAATTWDAFAYFTDASATSGPFSFGSVNAGVFTAYPTGGTCLLSNTVCLTSGDYLGAYKTFDGNAHPGSGTIDVPDDALIFHPGANGEIATVFFTVPTSGTYTITLNAFQATNTQPNSVLILGFPNGPTGTFQLGQLTSSSPSLSYTETGFFNAGTVLGLGVGYDGNYQYDSTGVNFTLTNGAVPEPAAWAMLMTGFGLVGSAMRRRSKAIAA
jgi:hypothetical protein